MSQGVAEKNDKLIHDTVNDRYELEWKRTNDLDSKASNVTGFAGLLATLTAGITGFIPDAHFGFLFLIPLTLFILSALFGLWASWVTSFVAINPNLLIERYKDKTEIETLRAITATTSEHTLHNFSLNGNKVRYISVSFFLLVLAVVDLSFNYGFRAETKVLLVKRHNICLLGCLNAKLQHIIEKTRVFQEFFRRRIR